MTTNFLAGDSLELTLTAFKDQGGPLNLTDCEIEWVLKLNSNLATPVTLVKTLADDEIEIVNAAEGLFKVKLTPADTEGLYGTFIHFAQVTYDTGEVHTLRGSNGNLPQLTWIRKLI